VANDVGLDILVVGRRELDGWTIPACRFLPDEAPGLGPLGGLVSALRACAGPVMTLACDLPLLTPDAVRWLLAEAEKPGLGSGIVSFTDRPQPLFAVYAQTVLPTAAHRLMTDDRSLRGLIAACGLSEAVAPDWVGQSLRQANTPQEWQQLTHPE
jgi:molybdopterin-guanine dinucleotide biosynthesis protein A